MAFRSRLTDALGLRLPILQAPMLGASTIEMAAAVSRAGGLGAFAAAGTPPAAIAGEVARLAAHGQPFQVNLFVLDPADPDPAQLARAVERLKPWRIAAGLPAEARPNKWAEDSRAQLDALIDAAPPAASFTFGCLDGRQVAALKARGTFVIGTATTVAEARAWAAAGADAICAQGMEAGGHRGTFLAPVEDSLVGTLALVPAVRAAVDLPVIAAGGIMDGRGIAAALLLGAEAVQLGTAFLLSPEAATNPVWRQRIADAGDDPTRLTRVISGRYARGIENRIMRELRGEEADIPPYPVQNALTAELRAAAARAGSDAPLSLWAGQGVKAARALPAAALVETLWAEAEAAVAALAGRLAS
ncbi:MAG: nitronate monooxygenase [Thalassobaculales bacterium]